MIVTPAARGEVGEQLVGARVVFTEMHVEGRSLAGTVRVAWSDTAEGLTREFVDFVRARRGRGRRPPQGPHLGGDVVVAGSPLEREREPRVRIVRAGRQVPQHVALD
jgi:hypothetical protein